jgi:putative ABC transport system substrate-binding protein
MRKTILRVALGAMFLAFCSSAEAQQSGKIPRIGYVRVVGVPSIPGPNVEVFRQGMKDLGYVEGKNILIEFRYVEGKRNRVPSLVAELVQLKVDVLISGDDGSIRAAKEGTKTIPIVMVINQDPVATGLVDSLARPGGNVTGLTRLSRELSGKRLELLTEVLAGISRVAVLWGWSSPSSTNRPRSAEPPFQDYESPARALKIALQILEVRPPNPDLAGAFRDAVKGRAQALIAATTSVLVPNDKKIAELAIKHRLLTMLEASHYVGGGSHVLFSQRC